MENLYNAFISYGRADSKVFATKLHDSLVEKGLKVWFDQNDIPLGVDFQNQINDGIAKAHNFIFIIAPHSVNSPYCLKEIELAVKLNKRIIPLLHVEQISQEIWQQRNPHSNTEAWEVYKAKGLHTSYQNMHPAISKINWVYFREEQDNFENSLAGLINLIHKHTNYVEKHTKILLKALAWEKYQKQTSYLLIGEERRQAESWLKIRFKDEQPPCEPTDIHCEFVCESIKNANNLLTQVYICYTEQDKAFMQKIIRVLLREGLTVWTNDNDITTNTELLDEFHEGIEQSDNFIYLISSDSVQSKYCLNQLNHALANHKRIICLLIEHISIEQVPLQIKSLQFIDFTDHKDDEQYRIDASRLLKILNQDADYYEQHKILLVKALKWKSQNSNKSILLRGYDLQRAEAWLKVAKQREEHPPLPLHEEFINTSSNQPTDSSREVFISYSRADSDFARQLNESLQLQGKTTWFDQESIALGSDYQQEIYRGIESANNFLFILSPKSIKSPYCADEVEYARKLNKRIVTVLYKEVSLSDLHPALASIQWIDFYKGSRNFYANFSELIRVLDTDREYVRNHSKWLQQAIEWEKAGKNPDLLLRGSEFSLAEKWLKEATQQNKQPPATELQKVFITVSSQAIATEIKNELRLKVILKSLLGLMSVAFVAAALFSAIAYKLFREAKQQELKAQIVTKGQINALSRYSLALSDTEQNFEALIEAIRAGKQLKTQIDEVKVRPQTRSQVQAALLRAFYAVQEVNRLTGHDDAVTSVAISPDGQTIASSSDDSTVKLWNLQGELLQTLKGHNKGVYSVAFSPDGKTIATASWDNTIKLWNLQGKLLQTFVGHSEAVYSVAFSPDGGAIASGSDDGTIKLWDLQGKLLQTLVGHTDAVYSVAFSPDGKTIASASWDKTVRLWNLQGKLLQTLTGHDDAVTHVVFSPDGQTIASASWDKTVRLWNLQGKLEKTLVGHNDAVYSAVFSADGQRIASASEDNTVIIWNLQGEIIQTLKVHNNAVNDVVFSFDGQTIVTASRDGSAKIWKLQNQISQTLKGHGDKINSVVFSPDGQIVATASNDKTIKLWSRQGQLLRTLKGHSGAVNSISFSPDSQIIASASNDKTIKLWSRQGQLLRTFNGHSDVVNSVFFSPNGQTIASASSDKTVNIWSLQGQIIQTLKGHSDAVFSVVFGPRGHIIATSGRDGTVRVWNLEGKIIKTFTAHSDAITSIVVSPDSSMIATVCWDGTAKIWNLQGQVIQNLKGHKKAIYSVVFSPDSKIIATASSDNTIKLWNLQGQVLQTLKQHQAEVNSVAFSPDGKTLASASGDKTAILWNLALDRLDGKVIQDLTLDELLIRGCHWVGNYLRYNPSLDESDRALCDDIEDK